MRERWSRWRADERGSLSVGIPIFAFLVLLIGALLFRVGIAADLRAGTQTAADAAALAAAKETGVQIVTILTEIAAEDPEAAELIFPTEEEVCGQVDDGGVEGAAAEYAAANGAGGVTGVARDCMEVSVEVQSDGGVPPVGGYGDESGPSAGEASAVVEVPGLPGASVAEIVEMVEGGAELEFHLTA
jgi:hypothetical protein